MNHFVAAEIRNQQGRLAPDESHHASRVLRLRAGDLISVTQGDGKVYRARINEAHPKETLFQIEALLREEKKPLLKIALAPTKSNDRFEFFLEKATELGVSEITPLLCQHSERKIYKEHRGEKIILSAVKQSKKGFFPVFNPLTPFAEFLHSLGREKAYIAHLAGGDALPLQQVDFEKPCWVLIGPEGDFSPEEIAQALEAGIAPLRLGTEVLRTETAGVMVAAASNLFQ